VVNVATGTEILQVGIDDTDSPKGMCTTYVGAVAIDRLKSYGFPTVGLPKLIRLNPGCKWKTRGNCAIAFRVKVPHGATQSVKNLILKTVEELAELKTETTDPGVVFYPHEHLPPELVDFSKRVVQDIVTIEETESLANEIGAEVHKFKLGRGIVGALAAIGHPLDRDWTFEFIAYRTPENRGKPRIINQNSVIEMDRKTQPETFDNLDPTTGEIRITPHTPCPILYGIRGETPEAVREAHEMVKALEPIERTVIYKTNQGTDEHLKRVKISEVKSHWSVSVKGVVSAPPKIIRGGHVIFKVRDETGEIDCAAYEPTRQFREVVKRLIQGDSVIAHGGVRKRHGLPLTVNLEKLEVLKLKPKFSRKNPRCPRCGKSMKSEGKMKGYSCRRCKTRAPPDSVQIIPLKRDIDIGKFETPPRARRHLARPLIREIHVKFPAREF
jgi:tRNA(Ile2)-agmatinylcytidine synthase